MLYYYLDLSRRQFTNEQKRTYWHRFTKERFNKVNSRKERKGVSPKTKEMMIIPASKTVSFKPSNRLKDAMN